MSKVFIEEETLIGIGNAIREKSGTTDLIATTDMATAISNLATGGGGGGGNQSLPVATQYSDTQITGVKNLSNTTITFDLSKKINPYDYNWIFATSWAISGSTKYRIIVLPQTTVFPDNTDTEIKIDAYGVLFLQYGKSGSVYNSNINVVMPYALYVSAYYNPSTCQLRLQGSTMGESQFKNYADDVGQLYHRKSS